MYSNASLVNAFGKIDQVIIIADIMIIGCKPDHSDHDQPFTNLLQVAKQFNIKLNYDKFQFKQNEVEFLGETYTTCGCKPSKDKVAAIKAMSWPINRKQALSFIGMVNYLAKLSPRLSEIAEPIRELSKDKVPFTWGPEHEETFTSLRKEIASAPMVAYYNTEKQTILQIDASIKGFGAFLLQESKPIYFASKALTDAQKGYVLIEFEVLAVAWAMEILYHFLYASHFLLETDQKLLGAIIIQKS